MLIDHQTIDSNRHHVDVLAYGVLKNTRMRLTVHVDLTGPGQHTAWVDAWSGGWTELARMQRGEIAEEWKQTGDVDSIVTHLQWLAQSLRGAVS